MALKDIIDTIYSFPKKYSLFIRVSEQKNSTILKPIRLDIQQKIVNNSFLSPELIDYFKDVNEDGQPYICGIDEPRQITQIKKNINALYHAEQAFILIEQYSKSKGKATYSIFSRQLSYHIYEAMHLVTHLDVNVSIIFQEQLQSLRPIWFEITKVLPNIKNISDYNSPKNIDEPDIMIAASKLGAFAGTFVDIMRPAETFNYQILTDFSSKLPEYIKTAKIFIANIGSKALEIDSSLEQKDIKQLEQEANKLIDSITNVQANSLFNIRNIRHYISIINRIITISNAIIYQFKSLNTTSHQRVKEWLYKFKFFYIPKILTLADSLEEILLLRAGFISEPLLIELTSYYDQAISKLSFVDFNKDILGAQVINLVDYEFTQLRLKAIKNRVNQSKIKKIIVYESEIAKCKFYELLKEHNANYLGEMSLDIKHQLKKQYRLFQKYMVELAPDFDETIVNLLNQVPRANNPSFITRQFIKLKNITTQGTVFFDVYAKFLSYKVKLSSLMNKELNTYDFQILLNEKIIKNIPIQTLKYIKHDQQLFLDNVLAPYSKLDPAFIVLSILSTNKSEHDFLQIYFEIINKASDLKAAYKNYLDFVALLNNCSGNEILSFSLKEKQHLREIYQKFQPFLVNLLGKEGLLIDEQLVSALNPPFEVVAQLGFIVKPQSFDKRIFINRTKNLFLEKVRKYNKLYKKQVVYYKKRFKHKFLALNNKDELFVGSDSIRRSYLIKKQIASASLADIREKFNIYLNSLNKNIADKLCSQITGLPFPELEGESQAGDGPAQVLAIKRVANSLYYIEEAIRNLEDLNDTSLKETYVATTFSCVGNFFRAYDLLKSLKDDPYVFEIKVFINNLIIDCKQNIDNLVNAHVNNASKISVRQDQETKIDKILKPIFDLFFKSPCLVRDFTNNMPVNLRASIVDAKLVKADALRKRVVFLVNTPNSWIQVLFKLPEVKNILVLLKQQLLELTTQTHQAVSENLFKIKTYFFVEMLSKADYLENKLGLKSGTISDDAENVLNNIFDGFIHSLHVSKNDKFVLLNNPRCFEKRLEHYEFETKSLKNKMELANKAIRTIFSVKSNIAILQSYTALSWTAANINAKQELEKSYRKILPQLQMFDQSLNNELLFDSINLAKINLANSIFEKMLLDQKATFELSYSLCLDKIQYLKSKYEPLTEKYKESINQYGKNHFKDTIAVYAKNKKNIELLSADYLSSLTDYASKYEPGIIEQALKNEKKIDVEINDQLEKVMLEFNAIYLNDFRKLNALLILVMSYQKALDKENSFDVQGVIARKRLKLNEVLQNINDTQTSANQRLIKIKALFSDDKFQSEFLEPIKHSNFSLAWFVDLFNKILKLLHIRTPLSKQIIDSLNSDRDYNLTGSQSFFGSYFSKTNSQNAFWKDEDNKSETFTVN